MNAFTKLIQATVKQYIIHNNIKNIPTAAQFNERFNASIERYYTKIQETVQKDYEAASFGLKTKKPTALQQTAANISMNHGMAMYAKYLVTGIETIDEIK